MKKNDSSVKIKKIFEDNWDKFWELKSHTIPKDMREDVLETVNKMMKCGDPQNGYAQYLCLECNGEHHKIVPFTCKSRFCNKCGKTYIDKWVAKQLENMLDVSHRHLVFTIPEELRSTFYWNRKLLKELSDKAAEVVQYWYKEKAKKKSYQVGVITVIHTFGRDLKFNPHVHALITEGAIDKQKNWKSVGFIPYEYLRKSWQKVLLDAIKESFGQTPRVKKLINELYKKYKKGFYVNAERKMDNAKKAAKYIGRYLARPAIAEYRIIKYDGKRVRFWYEDHETKERKEVELDALDFIGKLIMHIPPKHYKMARRYGLYRRDLNKLAQTVIKLYKFINKRDIRILQEKAKKVLTYKERMIENFNRNPLVCPKCKKEMELWTIWHPEYGYIYRFEDGLREVKEDEGKNIVHRRNTRDTISRQNGREVVQLSLY